MEDRSGNRADHWSQSLSPTSWAITATAIAAVVGYLLGEQAWVSPDWDRWWLPVLGTEILAYSATLVLPPTGSMTLAPSLLRILVGMAMRLIVVLINAAIRTRSGDVTFVAGLQIYWAGHFPAALGEIAVVAVAVYWFRYLSLERARLAMAERWEPAQPVPPPSGRAREELVDELISAGPEVESGPALLDEHTAGVSEISPEPTTSGETTTIEPPTTSGAFEQAASPPLQTSPIETEPVTGPVPTIGPIRVPAQVVLQALPPGVLAQPVDALPPDIVSSDVLLSWEEIGPKLATGEVRVAAMTILSQLPHEVLAGPATRFADELPDGVELPLAEIVMRIPPEVFAPPDDREPDIQVPAGPPIFADPAPPPPPPKSDFGDHAWAVHQWGSSQSAATPSGVVQPGAPETVPPVELQLDTSSAERVDSESLMTEIPPLPVSQVPTAEECVTEEPPAKQEETEVPTEPSEPKTPSVPEPPPLDQGMLEEPAGEVSPLTEKTAEGLAEECQVETWSVAEHVCTEEAISGSPVVEELPIDTGPADVAQVEAAREVVAPVAPIEAQAVPLLPPTVEKAVLDALKSVGTHRVEVVAREGLVIVNADGDDASERAYQLVSTASRLALAAQAELQSALLIKSEGATFIGRPSDTTGVYLLITSCTASAGQVSVAARKTMALLQDVRGGQTWRPAPIEPASQDAYLGALALEADPSAIGGFRAKGGMGIMLFGLDPNTAEAVAGAAEAFWKAAASYGYFEKAVVTASDRTMGLMFAGEVEALLVAGFRPDLNPGLVATAVTKLARTCAQVGRKEA